jgi:hypothetical protein
MDEPTQLPSPLERMIRRMTAALQSHTNAILEAKALLNRVDNKLGLVIAKLDHLIADEAREATDVREIRQLLVDAGLKLTETRAGIAEARKDLEEITGTHRTPSREDLEAFEDANRWRMLKAVGKFFKDHWPHITLSSGFGATLYHLWQKLFH